MIYHVPVTFKVLAHIPVEADSKAEAIAELREMPPEELPDNYLIDDVIIRAKEFKECMEEDTADLFLDDLLEDDSDLYSDRYDER
jgi:hypothetical protein